ncbi:MAG: putative pterin-4-alpha-carbinolamine dehydratase [Chroococcopsis gigantea SAG 12.99]|jgi:4a-hydroxytetrahydrobiopterin dehydratase|nr:putative pterin-4-alpha-carbinolamine dehydratase [Chroococcopsis gigantea SAG 12.99]
MTELKNLQCEACRPDSPRVTGEEIQELLPQLPGWELLEVEGNPRLQKVYKFPNFLKALAFTNAVGAEAEKAGHHPGLLTEWGKVTVSWWTHDIGGLHKNDFILAARTDSIKENLKGD